MTCLAMLRDKKGNLWFAGDRKISWNYAKSIRAPRPKITKRSGVLLAGTGHSAICDLVTDLFDVPEFIPGGDTFEYMHGVFLKDLISWLKQEGWVRKDERALASNGKESDPPMAIIVIGVEKDLYELDLNTQTIAVCPIDAPYATGCGGQLALGSLLTTEGSKLDPKERLKIALRVAAKVSPGCDANIDVLTNGGKK